MALPIESVIIRHPKFAGLSSEARQIVLSRVREKFTTLSPEAQAIVMKRLTPTEIGPVSPPIISAAPSQADMLAQGQTDLKGLLANPTFQAMPTEQRRALIEQINKSARARRLSETEQGTATIGAAIPTLMTFAPTSLAATPALVSTAARVGQPLGKKAALAVAQGKAFSPLAESVGLSGMALRKGVTKAIEAPARIPAQIVGGTLARTKAATTTIGKRTLSTLFGKGSEVPESLRGIINSEVIQALVGGAVLAATGKTLKSIFGKSKGEVNPITGRGIPGETETELFGGE